MAVVVALLAAAAAIESEVSVYGAAAPAPGDLTLTGAKRVTTIFINLSCVQLEFFQRDSRFGFIIFDIALPIANSIISHIRGNQRSASTPLAK